MSIIKWMEHLVKIYTICAFWYTSKILAFHILIFFKWNIIFSKMSSLTQTTGVHFYNLLG